MNKNPIGFSLKNTPEFTTHQSNTRISNNPSGKTSLVDVYFPSRDTSYPYFNDTFDLKVGDAVYVEGKLEGCIGRVKKVKYGFKIKLSDYKKVIALVDTNINGELYTAISHLVAFDKNVLPYEKIMSWFTAPSSDYEDYLICQYDDESFPLDELSQMDIYGGTRDKGYEYYSENRVGYISLDGTKGRAIVKGHKYYEVDFELCNGQISNLFCPCYCTSHCKHELAAMLQLRETLDFIIKNHSDKFKDYFAAVSKDIFLNIVLDTRKPGCVRVDI